MTGDDELPKAEQPGAEVERYKLLSEAFQGRRQKRVPGPDETSDESFWRRSSGLDRPDLHGDGFVLDGVAAGSWFASVNLPDAPSELQEQVAELMVEVLKPYAEQAALHRQMESLPPHTAMLFFRTNFFLRLKEIKKLKVSVTAGLMVDLLTSSPPIAVGVSVASALWDNVRRLSDDEVEVVRVMQTLSGGHVYKNWLPLEDIVAALPAEDGEMRHRTLIAGMQSRGLLEEAAGMYRVVR